MVTIPLADITIPDDRARVLDPAWADGLAAIIAEQGLTNPITVRQRDGEAGYCLVTGLHRIAAVQRNGATHIAARLSTARSDDEARLEEVMENLGRHELKALDRCRHLFELKRVYEKLHPETKAGVAGANAKNGAANEIFSFAEDTAKAIGLNTRTIQLAVKIWKDLTPDSRSRLVGKALASKQTELKLLSEQTRTTQAKVLDLILAPESGVENVQGALDTIENGRPTNSVQQKADSFTKSLTRLDQMVLDKVAYANADLLITALKRVGAL